MYPLLELQSKKRISKTVAHKNTKGETKTMHLVVEGPVSVAGCTTKEYIYEDNANRSFLIYLDESEEQDQRIMDYQRRSSAGKINKHEEEEAANLLQNCQRLLEPIKIVNPFAELLQIPKEVFKPRRTNNHYLQFIEVVTFYHQHQRAQEVDEETGELFIETTLEDVEATNQLLKESLLRKSDELNGACINYLEQIKAYLEVENKKSFSNLEIRKKLRINQSNQKRWTINLVSNYFLKRTKGNKNQGYQYQITSYEEYRQLKEKINCALDQSLEALKSLVLSKAEGLLQEKDERSKAVQTENEPSKSKRIRSVKV
jgi:predicted transcriptional regulator